MFLLHFWHRFQSIAFKVFRHFSCQQLLWKFDPVCTLPLFRSPHRLKEHPARLPIWKTSRCQIKETTDEINNKDTWDNLLYCTGVATTLKINGEQVRQIKAPPSHNKPTLTNQGNLSKQGLFGFTAVPSSGRFEASAGICLMQQEWTLMPSNSK